MPRLQYNLRVLERARLSRDARFDGKFFIAVTSTRVYCRPICPAQAPKASNVRYYATAAEAAEAGFRPCLRCRPEAAPGTPAWLGASAVVRRALRLIQDGALDELSIEQLAVKLGVSVRHLHRLFVQHVGVGPIAVAQTRRLHFAKRLLDETELPITQVALASGFGSVRRFNDAFRSTYRRAPRELRGERRSGVAATNADEVRLKLAFRPPYDWAQVRDFFALRAIPGIERVDEAGYSRTVAYDGGRAVISVRPLERENALELRVRGAAAGALYQISSAARRTFDLACDPERVRAELASDALLAPLVARSPGLRIPGAWDPFECAVRAVLGQQVSVAAARTLAARIVARAGEPLAAGEDGLTHLFPSPGALVSANLDGLGVTGARIAALKALAQAVLDRRVDFSATVEETATALTSLPGFGAWTAQYIALRALGDPDAFPAADLVLRRMAGSAGSPLTTRQLEERAEAWRPWRGYAVMHLWRAAGQQASSERTAKAAKRSQRARRGAKQVEHARLQ